MKNLLIPILLCAMSGAPEVAADPALVEGRVLFTEICAPCHGATGAGDGPEAARLNTPPADLTMIAARRGGVWPMLEVMSIIDGYTKDVTPREDMPVITRLSEGPMVDFDTGNGLVTSFPERLIAVADYLESIQVPRPERYVP